MGVPGIRGCDLIDRDHLCVNLSTPQKYQSRPLKIQIPAHRDSHPVGRGAAMIERATNMDALQSHIPAKANTASSSLANPAPMRSLMPKEEREGSTAKNGKSEQVRQQAAADEEA